MALGTARALPVPIEDLADSVDGLLVRDVEDVSAAPGAPALGPGQAHRTAALSARRDLGHLDEAAPGPPAGASRSATSGVTGVAPGPQRTLFRRSTSVEEDQMKSVPEIEEEASRFAAAL